MRWPVYANHASIGPLPDPARDAMHRALALQAEHGVAAMPMLFEQIEHTRAVAGALMGVSPALIAFMPSTTAAISAVANTIPWSVGDRIVLFRGEFPSNTTPWQVIAKEEHLDLVWLDLDDLEPNRFAEAMQAHEPRLVAVSAVQFRSGLRAPVAAMAEAAHHVGAELFVDAIQGLGNTPMALHTADYVAVGGQKWLMGPMGTAVLYAHEAGWLRMRPRLAGWLSHEQPLDFLFGPPNLMGYDRPLQRGPALLEGGTLNLAGLIGLGAAMELIGQVGVEATWAHAQAWNDAIEPAVQALGFRSLRATDDAARSAILSLEPPADIDLGALVAALGERGLSVASPDGALRFSPSWPNALSECPEVVDMVQDAVAQQRP